MLSTLANSIATSLFGILTAAALEYWKDTLHKPHLSRLLILATVISLLLYSGIRLIILRKRDGFVDLTASILRMEGL